MNISHSNYVQIVNISPLYYGVLVSFFKKNSSLLVSENAV